MKYYINRLFISLLIICISVLLPVNKLCSQNSSAMEWEEVAEQFSSNTEDEEIFVKNYMEELSDIKEHPFNINTVTKEQLERFPFLSDIQIENILFYLYSFQGMKTIYELQLIKEMDRQTIQYLIPFIYIGKEKKENSSMSLNKILKYGKHEITTRLDIPLYKKVGYRACSDSILLENPNKQYMGSSFYHSVRYAFHYKEQLYLGLTAEKDAGEPFFAKRNKKGYDYYSFYFLLKNIKHLKALAIGNYRLSFGMGLAINMDYSMGKSSSVSLVGYRSNGIRKHSSTDEFNYFRGIATSYELGKFVLTVFYSHRKLDAIVNNKLITSLKKDGMHRIVRDFEKRNKVIMQVYGGNFTYQNKYVQLGLTGVYNFFNHQFIPEMKSYNVFYPHGKRFYAISLDYKYRWNKLMFSGETAICQGGGVAMLNILRYSPLSSYHVVLLQRHYARHYAAWFARSISEGSEVRNENGWYMGIEANPIKYWKLSVYTDVFCFPWLRYGIDKPSFGFDGLVQATYSPKQDLIMFWRYRYKEKDNKQHRFRYQLGCALQQYLSLRTTIDFISVSSPDISSSSKGYMISQMISYSFQQLPLKLSVNYGFFDTDNYIARLTTYERSMLYSFSIPSFYGKGIRTALFIRYDFNKYLTALVKISQTKYADREEVGTGLEMIEGNKKSDINLQMRCKF